METHPTKADVNAHTTTAPDCGRGCSSLEQHEACERTGQQVRFIGDKAVARYNIIGTNTWIHCVYEPTGRDVPGQTSGRRPWSHSTVTYGQRYGMTGWLGLLVTRDLPDAIAGLPAYSDERSAAVRGYQTAQYDEAYALIELAWPAARGGRRSGMGDIETQEEVQ